MAEPFQEAVPPRVMANVPPTDFGGVAGQTRLIVEAVKESVADLKQDVKEIKSHRVSDLRWHIGIFATGFVLLAGMLIAGYFRIEDRMDNLEKSSIRVDTKLEDLLQRLPPVQTPIPGKR